MNPNSAILQYDKRKYIAKVLFELSFSIF